MRAPNHDTMHGLNLRSPIRKTNCLWPQLVRVTLCTPLLFAGLFSKAISFSPDAFEKWIRPEISSTCYTCHNESRREGNVIFPSGNEGPDSAEFLAGKIKNVINRAASDKKNPHYLPDEKRKFWMTWIQSGGSWPEYSDLNKKAGTTHPGSGHWSFRKPVRLTPPQVSEPGWNKNPIDNFIFDALSRQGFQPSETADESSSIRRLYLATIGLVPDWEELQHARENINRFGWGHLVDSLLNRPEYGEKWARHWLDVARYADAKGYNDAGEVKYPFAFVYRDYVVEAMNSDKPFNQFIKEQIAGDQFTSAPDSPTLAGLGFLTVGHRFNFFPLEILDDRIDVVTRGFLGMTASCARCHDHKFDAISTEDYYALFSVFRNSMEPTPDTVPVQGKHLDPELQKAAEAAARAYHKKRNDLYRKIQNEMRMWGGDYLEYIVQSSPAHRTRTQPGFRTPRGLIRVKSAYASGGVIRWQNLLQRTDSSHPVMGMWHHFWNLDRNEIAASAPSILASLKADSITQHNSYLIHLAETSETGIQTMEDVAKIYGLAFHEASKEFEASEAKLAHAKISAAADSAKHQLAAFLYGPNSPGTFSLDESEDLYLLDESTQVRKAFAEIERVFLKNWKKASPRPMMMLDRPESKVVVQNIYKRGNRHSEGPAVPRRIPGWVSGHAPVTFFSGSGRKELAEAIASPDNPLTARIIVNRVWAWHFGQGLVTTPSDFGVRSHPPSHPQLLDFLANWFVDNNWSIKGLNRLILNSQTWKQSSRLRSSAYSQDPDNKWLWRFSIQKMDFENLRDSLLHLAGRLDKSMGGIPVSMEPDNPENTRRTIYSFIDRENLANVFSTFGFPSPDISAPERSDTTVPQQALFLMNSPFMLTIAEGIYKTYLESPAFTVDETIQTLFNQILLRHPRPEEIQLAREFLQDSNGMDSLRKESVLEAIQALCLSNEFQFIN